MREIRVELSAPARAAVEGQARLLLAWNESINLTAIRDPGEVARRHVVDSLVAVPELRRLGVQRFVDIGSGGGYPGLPIAAVLPAELALLVESVGKKASFLATAAEATGLEARVQVAARRAEDLAAEPAHRERWPAVLARAVGQLAELVELAFPLLERGGHLVAWKGELNGEELAAGRRAVTGLGGGHVTVVPAATPGQPRNRLVIITKGGATGSEYPRNPAARKRRPW